LNRLEVHVVQSQTLLSIFAETLAFVNGGMAAGALILRLISTRCGRRRMQPALDASYGDALISDPEQHQALLLQA
jgi:hypothetical protein